MDNNRCEDAASRYGQSGGARRRPPALQLIQPNEQQNEVAAVNQSGSISVPDTPFFHDDSEIKSLHDRIAALEASNARNQARMAQLVQECTVAVERAHQWQHEAEQLRARLNATYHAANDAPMLPLTRAPSVPPPRPSAVGGGGVAVATTGLQRPIVDKNENVLIKPMSPVDDTGDGGIAPRQVRSRGGVTATPESDEQSAARNRPPTVNKPYVACNYDYEHDEYTGGSKGMEAHVYVPAPAVTSVANAFYTFSAQAGCPQSQLDFSNVGACASGFLPLTVVKVSAPDWRQLHAASSLLSQLAISASSMHGETSAGLQSASSSGVAAPSLAAFQQRTSQPVPDHNATAALNVRMYHSAVTGEAQYVGLPNASVQQRGEIKGTK